MALAFTVISCTARWPKSMTFSGWSEYKHGARPFVPRIRGCGRIAVPKPGHQGAVTDSAGPSAVSDTKKFAVPSTGGHPDFDLDLGVGRRPDHRGDAAPCGGLQRRRVALCGAGTTKGPAGTDSAAVMVVSGRDNDFRRSQSPVCALAFAAITMRRATNFMGMIMNDNCASMKRVKNYNLL